MLAQGARCGAAKRARTAMMMPGFGAGMGGVGGSGGSRGMNGMAPGYGSSSLVGLQGSKQPGQPVTTARSARTSTGTPSGAYPSGAYPAGGSISAAPLPARTTSMRGMAEKKDSDVYVSKALALNSPRQNKSSSDQRHADLAKLQAMIAAKDKEIKEIRRQNDIQAAQYDRSIKEVRDALVARTQHAARLEAVLAGRAPPKEVSGLQRNADVKRRVKTSRGAVGRVAQGTPVTEHAPVRGDEIDTRLAELYNQTTSAIPFKRINKGCYIFGTLQVEMDIINHKLMIR